MDLPVLSRRLPRQCCTDMPGKKKRERKSGRLLFSEGTSQQAEHARTFGGKQKGKLPSESMRRAAGGAAYIMRQSEGEPEDSASDMAAAGYQAAGTAADAGEKALRSVKKEKNSDTVCRKESGHSRIHMPPQGTREAFGRKKKRLLGTRSPAGI